MTPHALRTVSNLLRGKLTYVHAGVTHRCNLRCPMCGVYKRAGELPEAPPERWREIARVLADLGATTISLGGGEPYVRQDLPEIVAAFADHGFRVRTLTNGVAVDEATLRRCVGAGLGDMSFSLDSLRPEVQAQFDGQPGGLEKRLANLAMIARVLPARVPLLINTVVTPHNLDDLPRLSQFAFDLGHQISFIPVHLADEPGDAFFGDERSLEFSADLHRRLRELIGRLVADKRAHGHIVNSRAFLNRIPDYLIENRANWRCLAGRTYLSLRPDGKASICHHYETSGAIEVEDIAREWTDETVRAQRAACPGCLRPCWTEVALLATDPTAMWDQAVLRLSNHRRRVADEGDIRRLAGLDA